MVEKNNMLFDSINSNSKQRNWKTPTFFVCCPENPGNNPLKEYMENLHEDDIFLKNTIRNSERIQLIDKFALKNDFLLVLTYAQGQNIKNFGVVKITFENGFYVHESLHLFFEYNGADRCFNETLGNKWNGAESIDDFCS